MLELDKTLMKPPSQRLATFENLSIQFALQSDDLMGQSFNSVGHVVFVNIQGTAIESQT